MSSVLSAGMPQALGGDQRFAVHRPRRCLAGGRGLPFEEDEAGAAQPYAAAELCGLEAQGIAQDREQGRVRLRGDLVIHTVDREPVRLQQLGSLLARVPRNRLLSLRPPIVGVNPGYRRTRPPQIRPWRCKRLQGWLQSRP